MLEKNNSYVVLKRMLLTKKVHFVTCVMFWWFLRFSDTFCFFTALIICSVDFRL